VVEFPLLALGINGTIDNPAQVDKECIRLQIMEIGIWHDRNILATLQ
jgi:hypothetical protein